ncbi:ANTAR domain-containing protein [Rhodococcus chondri]|uniref:ANTAR domain-containing protein n=1 Tax=Rhodococcus chondri TaxID=3065941 RepID=A0ABU7JXX6_9NOCA|nr:ANTAR domain-containing protein [Rhodococcus sp. CC-R104]MEE2034866.1 ANTAR domain-containing protein [Rhodococcus sp. CC-R104]
MRSDERRENAAGVSKVPAELSRQIALLAREFFVPDDLDRTLGGITAAAAELIAVADGIDITLLTGPEKFRSVAATTPLASTLDALQIELGQGPCLDVVTADPIIRVQDMRTETRWPAYAPAAVEAGVFSCLSVRLYTHRDDVGALNLFSHAADAFGAGDEALADILATQAAAALTAARIHEQLTSALCSRDIIGQAKGIIMERFGVDAAHAFEMLRRMSQNRNIPLVEIATRLIASGPERHPRRTTW